MKTYSYLDFLAFMGIGSAHPGGFALTEKILKHEKSKPEYHVLDVGCGTGITSAYIAKHWNCKVSAIDIHPEMVKKAKRRFIFEDLPIHLYQGNAENLPFKEESFDFVITESVTAFTTISSSLQEYYRVLKKGGVLLMLEMTVLVDLTELEKNEIQELYGIKEILTNNEWTDRIAQADFSPVTIPLTGNPLEQMNADIHGENVDHFIPIIEPSEHIDHSIYETWSKHEVLLHKYASTLGYSVFRATRI